MMNSVFLEGHVLAFCIYRAGLLDEALKDGLSLDSFTDLAYREIFSEVMRMHDAGEPPNGLILAGRLPQYAEIISGLASTKGEVDFFRHVRELKRFETLRQIHRGAAEVVQLAQDSTAAPDALLDDLTELTTRVRLQTARGDEPGIEAIVQAWRDERRNGPPPLIPLFPAGTEAAKAIMLHHGQILTIAAQSGYGKTALACGMMVEALRAGLSCCYLCLESSSSEIASRLAAAACGIPHYAVDTKSCSNKAREIFNAALDEIAARGNCLHVRGNDPGYGGGASVSALESMIERCRLRSGKCDLVCVDFVQILQPPKGTERKGELERINSTLDALHNVVTKYGVACIALSQCNRLGLTSGSEPSLDWLKNTSRLGEMSHCVAFLMRDVSSDKPGNSKHWLISRKTRGMPSFKLALEWNGAAYESKPEFPLP